MFLPRKRATVLGPAPSLTEAPRDWSRRFSEIGSRPLGPVPDCAEQGDAARDVPITGISSMPADVLIDVER